MSKTLIEEPANFWYFNNGITMLAENCTKQAFGGNDRSVGLFDCTNVTIVNGAQTVGTIGKTITEENAASSVQIRIIVVDDPESAIGREITRASNTQNRIDSRNFVVLDAEQERVRTELLIDGIEYEFREGEPLESLLTGFEFIEGITTLACAGQEISYVALAKGYVGGLYVDINSAPYKALFNTGTSSKRLWSLVRLGRRIDAAVKSWQQPESTQERGLVVHGNRLITHCIFRKLAKSSNLDVSESISDDLLNEVSGEVFAAIKGVIAKDYPDAYLAPLFKNVGKCMNIRSTIEN